MASQTPEPIMERNPGTLKFETGEEKVTRIKIYFVQFQLKISTRLLRKMQILKPDYIDL